MKKFFLLCLLSVMMICANNNEVQAKEDYSQCYVKDVTASPYTYKSIKISWKPYDNAVGYKIYRRCIGDWEFGGIESIDGISAEEFIYNCDYGKNSKFINIATFEGNDTTTYVDDSLPATTEWTYDYHVVPIFGDGTDTYEGGMWPGARSKVADTLSIQKKDITYPKLWDVKILTPTVYKLGNLKIQVTFEDNDSGVSQVYFNLPGIDGGEIQSVKRINNIKGRTTLTFEVPISEEYAGAYKLNVLHIEDASGNGITVDTRNIVKDRVNIIEEFNVEFVSSLSNAHLVSSLNEMPEGKTAIIQYDSVNGGILKKEVLDAVKGKNKIIVVYANSQKSIWWVIYGSDITGSTKNINVNMKISAIDGKIYGVNDKLLKVAFSQKGSFPFKMNLRISSPILAGLYDKTGRLNMYTESSGIINSVLPRGTVVPFGNYAWFKIDVNEAKTCYITNSASMKSNICNGKATLSYVTKTYSGTAYKPSVFVSIGYVELRKNKDYKVTYLNNKVPGTATVMIIGIGEYTGTITKHFVILPKKTYIKKVSSKKGVCTVSWMKTVSSTTGYEIQYSTKSSFSSGITNVYVKDNRISTIKIKKMKKGKKYYVRIRTYKIYYANGAKKKLYSKWSTGKKVIIK